MATPKNDTKKTNALVTRQESEVIVPQESNLAQTSPIEFQQQLQKFVEIINKPPKAEWLQKNPMASGTLYIPIGILQMELDRIFFGLWQSKNFVTSVIANELIGSIELSVFHPVMKQWITRTGSAGVMIRFKSDKKKKNNNNRQGDGNIEYDYSESEEIPKAPAFMNLSNKITNALGMDYPHLEAMCLRSAIGKLGQRFGRDINREHSDNYNPMISMIETNQRLFEYKVKIDEYENAQELRRMAKNFVAKAVKEQMSAMEIIEIQDYINTRYSELKNKK